MSKKGYVSSDEWTRDPESGALCSTDHAGLAAYKSKILQQKTQKKRITEMSDDINSLKDDFQEMKGLLKRVINSLHNN